MKYFEELEEKVLCLIAKNQELKASLDLSIKDNVLLREKLSKFEDMLLKETSALTVLAEEKAAIISGIEGLLEHISAFENAQQ